MQYKMTPKKSSKLRWSLSLLCLLLLMPSHLQAQFGYTCLFDATGCDYTEVSGGSNPGPGIRLNNQSEVIRLPYCSTQEEIIDAFEGWLTELIDPATECKRVRIEEIASNSGGPDGPVIDVSVISGSTFLHQLGFNVNPNGSTPGSVRLPATCGGQVDYDVIIQGDCELGDGSTAPTDFISAGLTLQVFETKSPPVPDAVSVMVCDSDTHIDTTFENWVNGFLDGLDLASHTTPLFCIANPLLCNEALQYGDCGPRWEYVIQRSNGLMQPIISICPGMTKIECFQFNLKRALRENDRNCGNRITVWSTNNYGDHCGDKTATSYFEIVAPTITASGPADPNPLPACSTPTQIQNAFNQWLGGFSYSTNQGACDVIEEFYVNGSTDALSRDQVEPFLCGGFIDLEYVVARAGCRGNRSEVITGRFEVEEIQLMAFAGRACHDQALGHVLETNVQQLNEEHSFEVLAVNNGDLIGTSSNAKAGDRIFANGLADDSWRNLTDEEQTVTYTIRPYFNCSPSSNEDVCIGESVSISFEISPLPQQLANIDFEVKMGEPLGMVLQPTGRGLQPTAYIAFFEGFDLCSEQFESFPIYTPSNLQNLLLSLPTTGCTRVCQDQDASIKITPLVNGCRGDEQEIKVKIIYNDDQPPMVNCADVQLNTDAGACFASGYTYSVTATDDCPNRGLPTILYDPPEGSPLSVGMHQVTAMATDAAGNTAMCSFSVTVIDREKPTISCSVGYSIQCLDDVPLCNTNSVVASDNCGIDNITCERGELPNNICGGTVTFTYTAFDAAGNAQSCTQIITIDDDVAPEISCPPDTSLYLSDFCITDTSAASTGLATATDNCNEVTLIRSDQVQFGCGSEMIITRTWTAMDPCGNSTSCDQTITVRDTISPEITCPNNVVLFLDENCTTNDSPIVTGMATATDNCSADQDLMIVHSDQVVNGCGSSYTINRTWTVTDACDNSSSCVQIITVSDTTAPTMDCLLSVDLGCNPDVPDALPTDLSATDNCGSVEITVVQGEPQQEGCYFRRRDTYIATDPCGNSTSCSRHVEWKEDKQGPEIFGAPSNLSIGCMDALPAAATNVTASDNCDGPLPVVFEERVLSAQCGGTQYQRFWTAVDQCGNRTTKRQIISLDDNVAPILTTPPDTTIEFGEEIPEPSYQVSDQCSQVTVKMEEVKTDGNPGEYILDRTWTARDGCGNITQASQRISVEDNTPPDIMIVNPMLAAIPNGGSMDIYDCEDPAVAMSDALIVDANPDVALVTFDKLIASNVCHRFGYYRKWKCGYIATDGAGNETEYSFYVLQYDTVAPELIGIPPDLALSCDAGVSAPLADVDAEDACQGNTPVEFHETQLSNPEDTNQSALLRTWSATDGCGNTVTATQTITFCNFDMHMAASEIGNSVWLDLDADGLQDKDEEGINGVKVNLYWVDPDPLIPPKIIDTAITQTVAERKGQFTFDYLFPGHYQIEIELPENMGITTYKAGANDTIDNDVEVLSAMTAVIHLDTNQVITLIDAGLVPNYQAPLAVELSSFSGSSINCNNYLQWVTASESNVEMFEVQRAQKDKDFVTIENILSAGAEGIGAKYAFEDHQPENHAQYRLKIIDLDGTFEYSKIISLDLDCDQGNISDVIIYPNPTQNISTLEFDVDKNSNTQVRIFDYLGRIITEENVFIHRGHYSHQVDLANQPDGIYWVQINTGKNPVTRKIIKTN